MDTEFWYPYEIRYTRKQVRWLLPHLIELREGVYPANPHETGYVGASHQRTSHSPFENICLIAAELDIRLSQCFPDNVFVNDYFVRGLTLAQLAQKYHRDLDTIQRGIENAISYISSGTIQRWHDDHNDPCIYSEWKGHYRLRKDILGVIPARGAERIPLKNIRPLAGLPLLVHTINQARQSKYLTRIVVSTESSTIASVAQSYSVDVINRPPELSQNSTPSLPVVQHAVASLESNSYKPTLVVLLQPTSPLRTSKDIDATIRLVLSNGAESAETRCGEKENGAVYVSKRDVFMKQNQILSDNLLIHEMPSERSIDIDTEDDFKLAEKLLWRAQCS